MANPYNAYIIANVLQDAEELRKRGGLTQQAFSALTGPLNRYKGMAEPYLATPGGHPAPLAVSDTTSTATAPGPESRSASANSKASPYSTSAAPSPAPSEGQRPSVSALTAKLGSLNTLASPTSPGTRTPGGVPKRAPPAAPIKRAEPEQDEKGERAQAKWDYKASADDELGFAKGDTLIVVERTTEDWWKGHRSGATGSDAKDRLFPANYVEIVRAPARRTGYSEKDPPPTYGSATASTGYPPSGYGGSSPGQGSGYGAPPPPGAGYGGYGGYGAAPSGYGTPSSTPYESSAPAGTQRESDEQRNARKEKLSKMASSNVGQAAIGGLAFGTAASIVGNIL